MKCVWRKNQYSQPIYKNWYLIRVHLFGSTKTFLKEYNVVDLLYKRHENRRIKMNQNLLLLFLFFLLSPNLFAQNGRKQVEEGNKLYEEEKYDEANNKYRDALIENPESPIVNFNIGDALYKKRNYEEAIKSYEKSLSSEDFLTQSLGYYNLANTYYKMGDLVKSIEKYIEALKLNPNDEDAKYNLEYVRAKLKDESQKQQQNPDQNQQQDQQQQDGQKNQDEQNQEQQDQQQQQEPESQDEQEKQEQQEQQNQNESSDEPNQEQEQQQVGEEKEISKEDAERILNALQSDEEDLLKKQKTKRRGRAFRGKDW